jgi:hypothetical protein
MSAVAACMLRQKSVVVMRCFWHCAAVMCVAHANASTPSAIVGVETRLVCNCKGEGDSPPPPGNPQKKGDNRELSARRTVPPSATELLKQTTWVHTATHRITSSQYCDSHYSLEASQVGDVPGWCHGGQGCSNGVEVHSEVPSTASCGITRAWHGAVGGRTKPSHTC